MYRSTDKDRIDVLEQYHRFRRRVLQTRRQRFVVELLVAQVQHADVHTNGTGLTRRDETTQRRITNSNRDKRNKPQQFSTYDRCDEARFAAAGRAVQQHAAPIRDAAILVPVLRLEEVLEVVDDHRGDVAVEHDALDGPRRSSERQPPVVAVLQRVDFRAALLLLVAQVPCIHEQVFDRLGRRAETAHRDGLCDDRLAKEAVLHRLTDRASQPDPLAVVVEHVQSFARHQLEVLAIRLRLRIALLLHAIAIEAVHVVGVFRRQREVRRRNQTMSILCQPSAQPIVRTIRFANCKTK